MAAGTAEFRDEFAYLFSNWTLESKPKTKKIPHFLDRFDRLLINK